MLTKETKGEIAKKFAKHGADTGSSQVQIALLTERIRQVSSHLKGHKKDHATQVGLLRMVSQRRRLLGYLKKVQPESYEQVIKTLDLRK